jgi:hypothetical protein
LLCRTNNIVWLQDFSLCNTYYFEGQVSVNIIFFYICVRLNLSFPSSSIHVKGTKYYNKPPMSLQEFLYFLFKYSVALKIPMIYFISYKEQSTFFYTAITLYLCINFIYTKVNQHSHTIHCCRKSQLHYTTKQNYLRT